MHILRGRDAAELLKVRAFKNGPKGGPWAQKPLLGWTISGQVCLNFQNQPVHIETKKNSVALDILDKTCKRDVSNSFKVNSEDYCMVPCPNQVEITDGTTGCELFRSTAAGNEMNLSIKDQRFLQVMENQVHKNASGHWEMPLLFRKGVTQLPDNRPQAAHRLSGLVKTLKRKPQMEKDYLEFMGNMVSKGHASPIPEEELERDKGYVWYLPHFGVYHPKKPSKVRVVFDASAEFERMSLNKA